MASSQGLAWGHSEDESRSSLGMMRSTNYVASNEVTGDLTHRWAREPADLRGRKWFSLRFSEILDDRQNYGFLRQSRQHDDFDRTQMGP